LGNAAFMLEMNERSTD